MTMRLFASVVAGSNYRHVRHGCSLNASAPMLDHEANWPPCPDCITAVQEALSRETRRAKNDPVRCENCAAWVLHGKPCSTCGAIAT